MTVLLYTVYHTEVVTGAKLYAPPRGCVFSCLKNTVSTYTKESSGMHYACDMDGSQTAPLRPVTVVLSSQSTMPWCHMGGFPAICHNEIRDITASLLTEVCNNVATEPLLQPLSGESMTARSANTDDGARSDIRARGFWNVSQNAFFDVRVFYPNASSHIRKYVIICLNSHHFIVIHTFIV